MLLVPLLTLSPFLLLSSRRRRRFCFCFCFLIFVVQRSNTGLLHRLPDGHVHDLGGVALRGGACSVSRRPSKGG